MFPDPDKIELSEPDGCLLLDYRPYFQIRLRIGSWEKGLLIHRWENGTWQPESEDPGLPLIWPSRLMEPTHPVRLFADRIPEHVRRLAEKFWHRQVNVLRMMSFSDRPLHMAQHAPVLLWFLADDL